MELLVAVLLIAALVARVYTLERINELLAVYY